MGLRNPGLLPPPSSLATLLLQAQPRPYATCPCPVETNAQPQAHARSEPWRSQALLRGKRVSTALFTVVELLFVKLIKYMLNPL